MVKQVDWDANFKTEDGLWSDRYGNTWESVYVTTIYGDEIASLGDLTDKMIERLNKKHGQNLVYTYQGGTCDGDEA